MDFKLYQQLEQHHKDQLQSLQEDIEQIINEGTLPVQQVMARIGSGASLADMSDDAIKVLTVLKTVAENPETIGTPGISNLAQSARQEAINDIRTYERDENARQALKQKYMKFYTVVQQLQNKLRAQKQKQQGGLGLKQTVGQPNMGNNNATASMQPTKMMH